MLTELYQYQTILIDPQNKVKSYRENIGIEMTPYHKAHIKTQKRDLFTEMFLCLCSAKISNIKSNAGLINFPDGPVLYHLLLCQCIMILSYRQGRQTSVPTPKTYCSIWDMASSLKPQCNVKLQCQYNSRTVTEKNLVLVKTART